jgi:hypothetical protein
MAAQFKYETALPMFCTFQDTILNFNLKKWIYTYALKIVFQDLNILEQEITKRNKK